MIIQSVFHIGQCKKAGFISVWTTTPSSVHLKLLCSLLTTHICLFFIHESVLVSWPLLNKWHINTPVKRYDITLTPLNLLNKKCITEPLVSCQASIVFGEQNGKLSHNLLNYRIIECLNLWRWSSPTPLLKQVHPGQVAQGHVQEWFWISPEKDSTASLSSLFQ